VRQSSRLIVNTVAVYCRMGLTVGIGLLTTRLALRALSADAFGLYALVLGTIGALGILSNAFMASVARHLAFEIGSGEPARVRETFSTAFTMTLLITLIVALLGVALQEPVLATLSIPPDLREHAGRVYLLCLLVMTLTILGNLFLTALTAHQNILLAVLLDLYLSLAQLAVLGLLSLVPGSRVVVYAALMAGVQASVLVLAGIACLWLYPNTQPRVHLFSRQQARAIGSFTGWSMLGQVSDTLSSMGWQWVLNLGFGTSVNAAMAIVQRLSGYQKSLAWAMTTPLRPAMVGLEAQKDTDRLRRLVLVSGKYPVLMMLFYLVPLEFEVSTVLGLWLGDYPVQTPALVRLVLICIAVSALGNGLDAAILARGTIGRYTLLMALPSAVTLVLGGGMILWGHAPAWTLPAVALIVGLFAELLRAWYVGGLIDLPVSHWLRFTVQPVAIVTAGCTLGAWAITSTMQSGVTRLLVVTFVVALLAGSLSWLVAMQAWERDHFKRLRSQAVSRLRPARGSETTPRV
jgi:O-antigen/teichoic acid export membrane protein